MTLDLVSPFPPQSLPRVWRWTEAFRGRVSDDFSPQTLAAFVDAMLRAFEGQKTWAVYADGELGGMITFERLSPWVGTAHIVCKPDFQGKGIAPAALRIAFAEMFAEGVGKLIFYPLAGNLAVGSLLVHMGAKREGCLRGQTLCGGKPTAINVYGLFREEFEHAISSQPGNGVARVRGDRGSQLDTRRDSGRPEKDADLDHHDDAPVVAGNEGPARPFGGV